MKIEPLEQNKSRIHELSILLNKEWGDFAPWSSVALIEQRLIEASRGHAAPCAFLALSDAGEILGTASIKLNELADHPEKIHWIGEVFIHQDLRGQGIGSRLIQHCIRHTAAHGIEELFLYTPDQQALYQRFGWRVIQETNVNGEQVSIMVLAT